jgi:cyclopropane fatty-acyl-phospholipid synthase-like methyltransferase
MDDKKYWENYYKKHSKPIKQSSFASFIETYLEKNKKLIELGCGNGRDSIFFSKKNINVLGVDQAENEIKFLNENYANKKLNFLADDFTDLNLDTKFDYIYSRFTFHSINEEKEDNTLSWVSSHLKDEGLFFLEARSINDPMYNEGKILSEFENFTDHYRRYMDLNKIIEKLENKNFSIIYKIENDGLAIHKNEDPIVIRIIAQNKII